MLRLIAQKRAGSLESPQCHSVSSHLLRLPAGELRGEPEALRGVFVHRDVELRAAPLHRQAVPLLIVQQAAEGGDAPGLRGGRTWGRRGGREREKVISHQLSWCGQRETER